MAASTLLPSPLPPPARPGIDWHTKGVACDTCATKRWTDCDKTGHARCTNCKFFGGSCHCNSMVDKSWAESLLGEARNRMKQHADPALCPPAPRDLNPMLGLNPADVPHAASLTPILPSEIQRNAFEAFGVPMPTQAELAAKKPRKQKTYGPYTPSTRSNGQHQSHHQAPAYGQSQVTGYQPQFIFPLARPWYGAQGNHHGHTPQSYQPSQAYGPPQIYGMLQPQYQQQQQGGSGGHHQHRQG